ncbi:putative glycoside hydrolase [Rhodococcus aerolatus]
MSPPAGFRAGGGAIEQVSRRTVLGAALAAAVSGAVAACAPDPAPRTATAAPVPTTAAATTPGPQPVSYPDYRLEFVRSVFRGDPTGPGTARWQWQVLQRDLPQPPGVAHRFFYATAVTRDSDPAGVTQCLPPDEVPDAWLLRGTDGDVITRTSGSTVDRAVDVAQPGFRAAAAQFLVDRCRAGGWSGVMLDEVNASFTWTWPQRPVAYPDDASWQQAQLGFVRGLGDALRAAGFALGANIGDAVDPEFCLAVAEGGQLVSSEFFVEGGLSAGPTTALTGAAWRSRVSWLERSQQVAPTTLVQDRTDPGFTSDYGLLTALLATMGSTVYGTSEAYTADGSHWPTVHDAALALGAPRTVRHEVAPGVWAREFDAGTVLVNATTAPAVALGRALPAASGVLLP